MLTTLFAGAVLLTAPALLPDQKDQEIPDSITKHSLRLPAGNLAYTAQAGQQLLRSSEGEVECRMFYVAYTKDDANERPVTFCFNGGPGSATLWLHMGGLGPRMAPVMPDGSMPKPPFKTVDNPDTWLDFTDLVMVDAPGAGFSRIAKPDLAKKYFGLRPDIRAFTEFVRGWLIDHKRLSSPIFIAGESYGGIRGAGLTNSLFQQGIAVSGFVSISGTNNFMTLDGQRGNITTYIGFLPTMAACAWYHKKLAPRFTTVEQIVKESTDWVDREYGPALLRGDALTDAEKDRVATKMAEYTGLSKKYCLGSNLKVTEFAFFKELLRDERLAIGRLDGRFLGKEETTAGDQQSGDPSNDAITPPFFSAVNDYLTGELGVKTTMKYLTFGDVYPWSYPEGSYAETASDLRSVLMANKYLRVLFACGYYDLACPFNASIFSFNQMGLDAESRSRVSFTYYPAGHMMYIEKGSRKKLHEDVAKFVAAG